jgi:dTDP-4-amino-4,6-dideoxygalactose transaminase
MIPCAFPLAQYLPLENEIQRAIRIVLESGHYILGPQLDAFEKEFADYLGASNAIGCGSGTDALVLALRAHDIGVGDEVIVPSHTATATIAAVSMCGAKPVFADIDSDFYTIDTCSVKASCTSRTKAVIAVHLYGQPADMEGLLEVTRAHKIILIEDCAQAVGSAIDGRKLGTIGDVGCFSFFPTKNLGAIGDAGAVVCSNDDVAVRLKRLRQYGWDERRISTEPGMNSRLDELQAAILRVKLAGLDVANVERVKQADRYRTAFADLPVRVPSVRLGALHSYHLFVLRVCASDRDRLIAHLAKSGVGCGIHYPVPVHKMPGFDSGVTLPVTDTVVKEIVSLPLFPGLDVDQQDVVISRIRTFYDK